MLRDEWVAGFFDGEGSIGIYRNGSGTFHLRTQITQNVSRATEEVLLALKNRFGGNLARMRGDIYRGKVAFNWQLNGVGAAAFLGVVLPHLRLKRDQAEIAIAWQRQHLPPSRDERGRMTAHPKDAPLDVGTATLLKALKRQDIDAVMAAQADLVDIVHTLRQVLCVKG